jgi:hypothetical protein
LEEKTDLKRAIESMTLDQKLGIIPIVKESIRNKHQNQSVCEFELDKLDSEIQHKLKAYVTQQVVINARRHRKRLNDQRRRKAQREEML